jgi:translocation and assembly module TamB
VQGPQLPETEVALQGRGSTQGLRLEPLSLQLLEGTLAARGELAWAPTLAWDLMVAADGINPAGLAVDFPGELSARLSSAGELTDAGPVAQVHIESLDGTLRGQPVRASGDVEYRAGRAVAKQLDIASGPNRLILDGEAGKRLALRFDIDAPELAAAYPGLSGALQGRGELSGTQQSPQLVSNLQAKAIAFDTLQIERLDLVARWQASGGSVTLEGTNWRAGGLLFERATAQLAGLPEAHRLTLDAAGPELVLGVTAKGKWLDALWDGTLQRLDLQQSLAGTWQLAAPVRLQAGAELAETQELCLQQAPAQLCLEGGWRAEPRLDLRGKLERLPIERFAALLPEALRVEGQLNGAFSLQGTPASPRAEFSIRPDNGLLRVQTDAEPLEIAYRDVRVDGGFANDQGSAEIGLNLGAAGVAEGRVTLGAAPRRELGGELVARFPDLALISGFVPTLEAVKGKLTADLELDGSLEAPQLEGELRVEEGSARVPDAGLELTDVGLTVRGDGIGPLLIDGGATSGDGRLTLAGKVDLDAEPGPALDLRIRGERFQAVRLPEANVRISPDLTLSGAEPYRLSGVLAIPYALIEVKSLPSSAVSVSSDEFIVGEEGEETTQAGASNLAADVRIQLGDEVTFKGFGLKTRLTGVLDASLDERGQQVYGKIELKDGAYKAFGQDLGIEQGRLLFAGPPASPALDLRAVRVSLDGSVKAYLAVTGPLSKPRTRVYSEPALPDTQALSYLLTGRGTDSAGSEQGLDIAAAAFSLGVDRGEPLLQTMQERLGLDELSVSSGDTGLESSAVTVGKYLNPNLYIGYTQNLFDPAGSVLLRLKLSEQVEVESRAGVQQSVDLFYKIEHD